LRRWYVLDIETTGLHPDEDEVVAIGYSELVSYRPKIFVRRPGEPEEFLFSRALAGLKDATVIGYNVGFDLSFLKERAGYEPAAAIDLFRHVKQVFGRSFRLKDIVSKLFPSVENDDNNGDEIPELWKKGDVDAIRYHLRLDIKRTWLLAHFLLPSMYLYDLYEIPKGGELR